jgi:hypothetical protein
MGLLLQVRVGFMMKEEKHVAAAFALRVEGTYQKGHRLGGDRGAKGAFFCLALAAKAVAHSMKERASDGRSMVLVQFDYATHLNNKSWEMGDKVVHSLLFQSVYNQRIWGT